MDEVAEREFREYVATRSGALYRSALLLTGHAQDAEDLLQTALSRLALRWTAVRRSGSPDGYVRRILYNQQVSWWRGARWRREQTTDEVPERRSTSDQAESSTRRIAVAQALRQLTAKQRAVIILRYYEDLPEAEVARILGCSVGNVRSQTHRTLARLRVLCPELELILEAA